MLRSIEGCGAGMVGKLEVEIKWKGKGMQFILINREPIVAPNKQRRRKANAFQKPAKHVRTIIFVKEIEDVTLSISVPTYITKVLRDLVLQ